jgi:hypothetical protein
MCCNPTPPIKKPNLHIDPMIELLVNYSKNAIEKRTEHGALSLKNLFLINFGFDHNLTNSSIETVTWSQSHNGDT